MEKPARVARIPGVILVTARLGGGEDGGGAKRRPDCSAQLKRPMSVVRVESFIQDDDKETT
jgi:hypothetical protein